MLIFLDTEFTGLGQRWPRLISIGLISEDSQHKFYAELIPESYMEKCSPWVKENVIPLLEGGEYQVSSADLRVRLVEWFSTMPRSIQIACDSKTDFQFLLAILDNCWPSNLEKRYFDLRPMVDTTVYDQAVQRYYTPDRPPHNALTDAQAYRLGWLAWMDANKTKMTEA